MNAWWRRSRAETDKQEQARRRRRNAAHLCALIRVARDNPDQYMTAFIEELRARIPEGTSR